MWPGTNIAHFGGLVIERDQAQAKKQNMSTPSQKDFHR